MKQKETEQESGEGGLRYSFTVPVDWDKPSDTNAVRCREFKKGSFSHMSLEVPYRCFEPKDKSTPLPLVVFLHGADTVGTDNLSHIAFHDVATIFADEAWQEKHPCYVLAPQYHKGSYWSLPESADAVHGLVKAFLKKHSVDRHRIYIYGFSAGGVGVFEQLKRFPDFYAAAIPICGATSGKELERFKQTPIWMLHAADDSIVRVSYLDEAGSWIMNLGSRDIYEKLKGDPEWDFRFTEYPEGYMRTHYGVHPHCSWVILSEKEGAPMREWLFSKRKETADGKEGSKE